MTPTRILVAATLAATALATGLVLAQAATKPPTIATMPPVVVKTVPQAGDTAVDPALTEIQVTFSKDMQTERSWSWCQHSPETFPEADTARIRYLPDKRTCVLPVKLQPGRTYVIWLNTERFTGFQDPQGRPAVPYLLVFETRK